jgi:hypothetical protein
MEWTLLVRLGVSEIAFSAVLLPLFLTQAFGERIQNLVKDRKQLLQAHLDYFFMGILLILAGSVLQPIPGWIRIPLIVGSIGNPTIFFINAFAPQLPEKPLYRAVLLLFCSAVVVAWIGLSYLAIINH